MGPGQPQPRAFLRVAGTTIARHQAAAALALGCRRVICIAREMSADLAAVQHDVEAADAAFHTVRNARDLAALVGPDDELVAFADGLLTDPALLRAYLEQGPGVLAQTAELGIPDGFERLDLNHASAGVIRIPGTLMPQLADMPTDIDLVSTLTRLALQGGVPMRAIPDVARAEAGWLLLRSDTDAHAIESDWIARTLGPQRDSAPSHRLARLAALGFGASLLHAGNPVRILCAIAIVVALLGVVTGWLGFSATGFFFCGFGWIMLETARALRRIASPGEEGGDARRLTVRNQLSGVAWSIDLAIVTVAALHSVRAEPAIGAVESLFVPSALILVVRLLPRVQKGGWTGWIRDRAVLVVVLAIMAAIDVLLPGMRLLVIAGLGGALALASLRSRLTPD